MKENTQKDGKKLITLVKRQLQDTKEKDGECFTIPSIPVNELKNHLVGKILFNEIEVETNLIELHELYDLFELCKLYYKRKLLYHYTKKTFKIELQFKKENPSKIFEPDIRFLSQILDVVNLKQDQIKILLKYPIERDELPFIHYLARYCYDSALHILEYTLNTFNNEDDLLSPAKLYGEQRMNALHNAIKYGNLPIINYFLRKDFQYYKDFTSSTFFTELSIDSYICFISDIKVFDVLYNLIPKKILFDVDDNGNNYLYLLHEHKSYKFLLELLKKLPEIFTNLINEGIQIITLNEYLNKLNWKNENILLVITSLFNDSRTSQINNIIEKEKIYLEIIQLLLGLGSNPNVVNSQGDNCLHIITSLLTLYINYPYRNFENQEKLEIYQSLIKLFISHECSISALNKYGETPLCILTKITNYRYEVNEKKIILNIIDLLIGIHPDQTLTEIELKLQNEKQSILVNHLFNVFEMNLDVNNRTSFSDIIFTQHH